MKSLDSPFPPTPGVFIHDDAFGDGLVPDSVHFDPTAWWGELRFEIKQPDRTAAEFESHYRMNKWLDHAELQASRRTRPPDRI